jgi:hypothetical protein
LWRSVIALAKSKPQTRAEQSMEKELLRLDFDAYSFCAPVNCWC